LRATEATDRRPQGLAKLGQIIRGAIGQCTIGLSQTRANTGGTCFWGAPTKARPSFPSDPGSNALRAGDVARDAESVGRLAPPWRRQLGRLLPEIVTDQPTTSEAAEYRHLFESVAQLLDVMCRARPCLLVLEDVHWADEMSLRLLKFVGHRLTAWRLLLVLTVREDDLADTPTVRSMLCELQSEAAVTTLVLPPLSREEALDLVNALAGTGQEAATLKRLAEQIATMSEGNPFMIVEAVRALREEPACQSPSPA
jgi:hypothetical protein